MLIALYLIAIVAANVITGVLGPWASIPVALLLIGATLTVRDRLHDRYGPRIMWVLIPLGALLSLPFGAGRIALASCAAFAASESVDTVSYHALRHRRWAVRSNGSNLFSSAVDSFLFPTLAFGAVLWPIVLAQFVAKVVGGAVWSLLLKRGAAPAVACALLVVAGRSEAQQAPKIVVQAQVGTIHYAFKDYHPTGNAGVNAILFLPRGASILTVLSRDVTPHASWVGVVALQYRLWSR